MALSMDEQRMLDELERKLAGDDPLLASRLTTFGRPGLQALMRARRVRILLTFLSLLVITAVSLAVYMLAPFRAGFDRPLQGRPGAAHATRSVAAPSGKGTGATSGP
jgi:hypothetical protein